MRKLFLAATLAIAAVSSACATTSTTDKQASIAANKATVKAALSGAFAEHDVSAVDKYFADPYIQHNPLAPSGIAALRGMIGKLAEGSKGGVDIHRMIGEGDLIATHTTYTGFGPIPLV